MQLPSYMMLNMQYLGGLFCPRPITKCPLMHMRQLQSPELAVQCTKTRHPLLSCGKALIATSEVLEASDPCRLSLLAKCHATCTCPGGICKGGCNLIADRFWPSHNFSTTCLARHMYRCCTREGLALSTSPLRKLPLQFSPKII